ncbi:MAG: DNA polymerase III subunit delta' [Gammaproteobacteria bacterium]|nr:MAG: DNA polymerase III subunit delta' [Gammaproteobacteria bacterium]RLA61753.1 MAG: DNA polymerase III subunit delta' [Gammaproteobacteria bacterium]
MVELSGLPEVSAPLPWQAQDWSQLNQQLANGLLPHALLLAGNQYTGKARLAMALSRLLLCHQPSGGLNCGHCHACQLSASGNHGDFRWLQPEEKSRVIKIDQVRSVVEFTNKTAGLGQRKVVVLAPADSMNVNAANALLKSLEEPAADTYLLLVCHRLHSLPATVRSRCQILKLTVPDAQQCLAWLDQATGEREQSERLLALADGRPLLAEQLFQDDTADALAKLRRALQGLLTGRVSVPEAAALFAAASVEEFLAQLAGELQVLLRRTQDQQLTSRQGRAAFVLWDEVLRLQRAVSAGANPNKQVIVDALLVKFGRELGDGPLGDNIQTLRGDVHA